MWLYITLSISFNNKVRLDIDMWLLSNPVSSLALLRLAVITCFGGWRK